MDVRQFLTFFCSDKEIKYVYCIGMTIMVNHVKRNKCRQVPWSQTLQFFEVGASNAIVLFVIRMLIYVRVASDIDGPALLPSSLVALTMK